MVAPASATSHTTTAGIDQTGNEQRDDRTFYDTVNVQGQDNVATTLMQMQQMMQAQMSQMQQQTMALISQMQMQHASEIQRLQLTQENAHIANRQAEATAHARTAVLEQQIGQVKQEAEDNGDSPSRRRLEDFVFEQFAERNGREDKDTSLARSSNHKIAANELWDGVYSNYSNYEFKWLLDIKNKDPLAATILDEGLTFNDAVSSGINGGSYQSANSGLFNYIQSRINASQARGEQILATIRQCVADQIFDTSAGLHLVHFLRDLIKYKTETDNELASKRIDMIKIPLGASPENIRALAIALRGEIARLDDSWQGSAIRPYRVMINALPAECNVQKIMISQRLGLAGKLTAMPTSMPLWTDFIDEINTAMAEHPQGKQPEIGPSIAMLAFTTNGGVLEEEDTQTTLYTDKRQDKGKFEKGKFEKGKFKCWHCGGEHKSANCDKDPCPKCGKRYCGFLRDGHCSICDGLKPDAKGVDGKPLAAFIKQRIEKTTAARIRDGLQPGEQTSLATSAPDDCITDITCMVLDEFDWPHMSSNDSIVAIPSDTVLWQAVDPKSPSWDTPLWRKFAIDIVAHDSVVAIQAAWRRKLVLLSYPRHNVFSCEQVEVCFEVVDPATKPRKATKLRFIVDGGSTTHLIKCNGGSPPNGITIDTSKAPSVGGIGAGHATPVIGTCSPTLLFQSTSGKIISHPLDTALGAQDIRHNIFSEGKAWDTARVEAFKGDTMVMRFPEGDVELHRDSTTDRLYAMDAFVLQEPPEHALLVTKHDARRNALIWHARMILTPDSLTDTIKCVNGMRGIDHNGVSVIEECKLENTVNASVLASCEIRDQAQMRRAAIHNSTEMSKLASSPGDLLQIDGFGPFIPGFAGRCYLMAGVDTFGGCVFGSLTIKHETHNWLIFLDAVDAKGKRYQVIWKAVRADNAGEFRSAEFAAGVASRIIDLEASAPHEKGGVGNIEAVIGILQRMARHMLIRMVLVGYFFGDALEYAIVVINFKPSPRNIKLSRTEATLGFRPDASNLRVFGCGMMALCDEDIRGGKHNPVTHKGIFVGMKSGGYVIHATNGRRYVCRKNAKFYELTQLYAGIPSQYATVDNCTQTESGTEPEVGGVQTMHDVLDTADVQYVNRTLSDDAYDRHAIDPAAGDTGFSVGTQRDGPRPRGGHFNFRPRHAAGEVALLATLAQMTDVDEFGCLAPTREYAFIASGSGSDILVQSPLGPYKITHPKSIEHAKSLPEAEKWSMLLDEAMDEFRNGVPAVLVPTAMAIARTAGEKIYRLQVEYKVKVNRFNGFLEKLKLRICLDGSAWDGIHITRAAGFLNGIALNSLFCIIAHLDMDILIGDVVSAYLKGDWPTDVHGRPVRRVFAKQLLGFETFTDGIQDCDEVVVPLWGAPPSGQIYDEKFVKIATEKCGFTQIQVNRSMYMARRGAAIALMGVQVDDFLIGITCSGDAKEDGIALKSQIMMQLNDAFNDDIKWLDDPTAKNGTHVGLKFDRCRETRRLQLSMPVYIDSCIEKYAPHLINAKVDPNAVPCRFESLRSELIVALPEKGKKLTPVQIELRKEIGALSYAAECIRYDVKPDSHALSRIAHAPEPATARKYLNAIWFYLLCTKNAGPTYDGKLELANSLSLHETKVPMSLDGAADGEYTIAVDASHPDPPDKGIAGAIHMLGGAAIGIGCNLIHPVMTSTTDGEIHAGSANVMTGCWVRDLHEALGIAQLGATRVFSDNMPQVQLGNGASPTRSRHISRRIAYCAEKVRQKKFLFQHIPDAENVSDFMTKWVSPKKVRKSIAYMFNRAKAVIAW